MKILFVAKSFPIHGGVESWLDDLIEGLSARGHEVVVVLTQGFRFHDPERYRTAHPVLGRCRVRTAEAIPGLAVRRQRALREAIAAEAPDVVVPVMVHDTFAAAAALRAAGRGGFALIYPVHEDGVWAFRAVRDHADQIDAVICVSRLMQWYILMHGGLERNQVAHIRCGARAARGWPEGRRSKGRPLVVGYCGKVTTRQKRVLDLLGFVEQASALGLALCIRIAGEGDATERLMDGLRCQGVEAEFLGQLTKDRLYGDFYPSLDALVIFSECETGPIVAWEAMAHGVLVVSSEYRGQRLERVLIDGECAITFPVGRPEIGAAKLAQQSGDITRIAERGHEIAERDLTIERMVLDTERLFYEVRGRPPRKVAGQNGTTRDGWLYGNG